METITNYWPIILFFVGLFLLFFFAYALYRVYFHNFKGAKRSEQSKLRIEAAKLILGIGLSILASIAGGLYATHKTIEANKEENAINKAALDIERMAQNTERFHQSALSLSNNDIVVRIGSINTLSDIATSDERFKSHVIEVLTNHVMVKYPWPPETDRVN